DAARHNMLHPGAKARVPHVTSSLSGDNAPVIAAPDYINAFAEQIRPYVPWRYSVLGTDGFGRSDTRRNLRRFFGVGCCYVPVGGRRSLPDVAIAPVANFKDAIKRYKIVPDKPYPRCS